MSILYLIDTIIEQVGSPFSQFGALSVQQTNMDTTVVSEARPSSAGAEDEEDEVVGEMGEGEDEDDDEVVRVLP